MGIVCHITPYSIRIIQYCTRNCSSPTATQLHPRSFSSSFLSLCTTFSLRKSLSPNLQMLASPPRTDRIKLTSPPSSQCDMSRLAGNSPHPAYPPAHPPPDCQRCPQATQSVRNLADSSSRSGAPILPSPHHQRRLVRLRPPPHPLGLRVLHRPSCVLIVRGI